LVGKEELLTAQEAEQIRCQLMVFWTGMMPDHSVLKDQQQAARLEAKEPRLVEEILNPQDFFLQVLLAVESTDPVPVE